MIKKKLIDNLIILGKKGKTLRSVSLALIFVVSFSFNFLKVIDVYKYKMAAVTLALILASVYSRVIMNFDNSLDAANFDENGMFYGEIVSDEVFVEETFAQTEYSEPKTFVTNDALELSPFDPSDWKYVLVNKDNQIEDSFDIETVTYGGYKVDKKILDSLKDMFAAAKAEGYNLTMASGYRTKSDQVFLYNRKINQYKNMGYSADEAASLASLYVTPPNTSEHQTGLAVDILSSTHPKMNLDFGNTKEAEWLKAHCQEFGFILRYPEGKEDITMINFEPWHFRYVGVEAAEYITESNLTLEEFCELIKKVNEP